MHEGTAQAKWDGVASQYSYVGTNPIERHMDLMHPLRAGLGWGPG